MIFYVSPIFYIPIIVAFLADFRHWIWDGIEKAVQMKIAEVDI